MNLETILTWGVRILLMSTIIYGVIPLALIFLSPTPTMPKVAAFEFDTLSKDISAPLPELETFTARDGARLDYRSFPSTKNDAPLMIFIHGSGWHSVGYHQTAHDIAQSGVAHLITPDLRGHGFKPGNRGDVAYIGQLEDDIADLIKHVRLSGQKIIIAGHSSGGGLAIRYAGGQYGKDLTAAVLIAPYLHHEAPTANDNSGNWAYTQLPRIIGLSMQNMIGIHALDNQKVLHFNHSETVLKGPLGSTATKAYSHRMMLSFNPRSNWQTDVAALPPFLLIAGSDDEAFLVKEYEPTLSAFTDKGAYKILGGLNHASILVAPQAAKEIELFLKNLMKKE